MSQFQDGWLSALAKIVSAILARSDDKCQVQRPLPALVLRSRPDSSPIGTLQIVDSQLTVEHARLWQYMSCRLISQPAGLLQFQMELAILLEELASKPRLQLVPA